MRGLNKLYLFVFHNTDTFYLLPSSAFALSVIINTLKSKKIENDEHKVGSKKTKINGEELKQEKTGELIGERIRTGCKGTTCLP